MTFGGKDNRGPSISELQKYIREKVRMRFLLNTGEEVIGTLRWFDEHAFSVVPDGEQPFTILRSAVVGYRKHNGQGGNSAQAAAPPTSAASASSTASQDFSETRLNTETQSEPASEPAPGNE